MKPFRVGLIQHRAVANNIQANLELGLRYVRQAKNLGADIVLFPEMWSNGYAAPFEGAFDNPYDENYESERLKWVNEAVDEDSEYVMAFRSIAKELKIGIVITYLSKGNIKPQNTALVIDKTGELLIKYSKVHTCDFSVEALLESGKEFKVCDFNGIKLGVMICFDREFPESARVLMLKGAEIILVPNACDMNPHRINQLSARAFENMVGVAMANYPGHRWGSSCAFSPVVFSDEGYVDNTIVYAKDSEEGIILAEFDLDSIRDFREREVWGNAYRKVTAYQTLLEETVQEPFRRSELGEKE